MSLTEWAQRDVYDEMLFALRSSSKDRRWLGLEAATYDVSAGIADRPPATSHVLVMHLGSPAAGTCRCGGPTQARVMCRGEMDFVPFGYPAKWWDRVGGHVLNLRFNPAFVESTAETMRSRNRRGGSFAPLLHLRDARLERLATVLVDELEKNDASDRIYAESVGTAIAMYLLRRHAVFGAIRGDDGLSRRKLEAVIDYIESNLGEDFGLGDLASIAALSPSHFKALFKRSTGLPVHQYVMRRRVDAAVRLIAGGRARLCDVAQEAGFAHESHMARCMRRMLGATPAEIARRFR